MASPRKDMDTLKLNLARLDTAPRISVSEATGSLNIQYLKDDNSSREGSSICAFSTIFEAEEAWKEKCNLVGQLKACEHLLQQQNKELQKRVDLLEVMKEELEERLSKKKGSKKNRNASTIKLNAHNIDIIQHISKDKYLCEVDGWQCQMKEVSIEQLHDKQRTQVEKEIQILTELPQHPNVTRYLHYNKLKNNSLRIFTSRTTLSLYVFLRERTEALLPETIQRCTLDLTRGLEFLHKNGIIHKKLKSSNVFVQMNSTQQTVAKLTIGNFDNAKKMSGVAMKPSTLAYFAPEVIVSGDRSGVYSAKSDIWSLGMLIYELLTFERPYHNVPVGLIPGIICSGSRPTLPDHIANNPLNQSIVELFHDCTRVEPEHRPPLDKIKTILAGDSGRGLSRVSQALSLEWMSSNSFSNVVDWTMIQEPLDSSYGPSLIERTKGYVVEEGCSKLAKSLIEGDFVKVTHYFKKFLADTEVDIFVNKDIQEPVIITIQRNALGQDDDIVEKFSSPRSRTEIVRSFIVMITTPRGDERTMIQSSAKSISAKDKLALVTANRPLLAQMKMVHVEHTKPIIEEMVAFEKKEQSTKLKFGVLYTKPGQKSEDEHYNNPTGSKQFLEFLDFLADRIVLHNWKRFAGGLDTTGSNNDGEYSYFTLYSDYEIMFHVSTLIKYNELDPQQVQRKKHLGNDVVLIIFKEADDTQPFSPTSIVSQFNHVFIVVQPVEGSYPTKYKMAVVAKDGVIMHPPHLPNPAIFNQDSSFRNFLLSKLINAERAAMKASIFSHKFQRVRNEVLKDICARHMEAKPPSLREHGKTPRRERSITSETISIKGGWNRLQPDQEQVSEMLALMNGGKPQ